MLKNLNDLSAADEHQQMFLTVFFDDFYSNVNAQRLSQLSTKIRDKSNMVFKDILLEYLRDELYGYA